MSAFCVEMSFYVLSLMICACALVRALCKGVYAFVVNNHSLGGYLLHPFKQTCLAGVGGIHVWLRNVSAR